MNVSPKEYYNKFASSRHTVVCFNGSIWVFGDNSFGQLGIGTTISALKPTKLESFFNNKMGVKEANSNEAKVLLNAQHVIAVRCGCNHTAVLTTQGLYMIGCNDRGQLGLGDTQDRHTPVRLVVRDENRETVDVLDVALGAHHTLIRTATGLYAFGCNKHGQLGLGDTTMRTVPTLVRDAQRHEKNHFARKDDDGRDRLPLAPISIACGGAHSLVLARTGLFVSGINSSGQLGLGHNAARWSFVRVPQLFSSGGKPCDGSAWQDCTRVVSGENHSFLLSKRTIYVTGSNQFGQLGTGDETTRNTFSALPATFPDDVDVKTGHSHTLFLSPMGLFACGRNKLGQLGLGDDRSRSLPTLVPLGSSGPFGTNGMPICIEAGYHSSIALTKDGLYLWGHGGWGELGFAYTQTYVSPKQHDLFRFQTVTNNLPLSNSSTSNNGKKDGNDLLYSVYSGDSQSNNSNTNTTAPSLISLLPPPIFPTKEDLNAEDPIISLKSTAKPKQNILVVAGEDIKPDVSLEQAIQASLGEKIPDEFKEEI